MTIAAASAAAQGADPKTSGLVKKMEGILWYNMLSEMNANGLDPATLGTGGDAYQSLFLWDIAQNDFGKYDTGLVSATLRQIGGRAALSPAPAVAPAFSQAFAPAPGDVPAAGAAQGDGAAGTAVVIAHAADLTRRIWPAVQMAAAVLGVPPVAVLAQAALETGWGNSIPGNNLFGIKAGDGQPGSPRATHEMVGGAMLPETASFRDYDSPQASVADYIHLIQSNFRTVIGQESVEGFADALQSGGFATDGNYASKIIMISQSPLMEQMLHSVGAGATPSD